MWDRIWDEDLRKYVPPITNIKDCFDIILTSPGYSGESDAAFDFARSF